ncbi:hypothetical protein [Phytoactinopolyspora halotolerans]|uniref:Uncharacterized protein n=1 Tax=Phytoactinopolyspora halotolerans TaxID=1981512 RepID=A0A6L9SGN6_9ACTN|nr:hypothetical protein [Phytoactinopolyspora halotolerans]NEE04303.1 hypothetical protein [Phytoactinopolyspora halotolerans]
MPTRAASIDPGSERKCARVGPPPARIADMPQGSATLADARSPGLDDESPDPGEE